MNRLVSSTFCLVMLISLGSPAAHGQQGALPADPTPNIPVPVIETLTIRVISGDNASNFLKRRFAVSPIVEVRDGHNQLVAGATVIFNSPEVGPGVRFGSGKLFSSAVTEMDGRATAGHAVPVKLGQFQMMVTASYSDYRMATAVLHQSNFKAPGKSKKTGVSVRMQSAAANR